jgi:hypothetical protein
VGVAASDHPLLAESIETHINDDNTEWGTRVGVENGSILQVSGISQQMDDTASAQVGCNFRTANKYTELRHTCICQS